MQTADILRSARERFDALPVPVKIGIAAGGSVLLIAVVIGLFASGPAAPTPAATAGPAAVVVPPAGVVVPPAGVAGSAPDAAAATAPVGAATVVDVAPAAPPQILQLQRLRETWSVGTRADDWKEVAAIERDARTFLFSSAPTGDLADMMRPSSGRFFAVEATGYFRVAVPGEHTVIVSHSASVGNAGVFAFLNDSTIPLAQSAVRVLGGYTHAAESLVTTVELTPGIHRLRVVARQDSVRGAPMEVQVMLRAPGDPVPVPVVPGILTDEIVTPTAPAAAPATPAAPAPAATAVAPIAATATPVAPSVPGTPAAVPAAVPGTPTPAAVAPIAEAATPVAPRAVPVPAAPVPAAPAPAAPVPAAPVPAPVAPVR